MAERGLSATDLAEATSKTPVAVRAWIAGTSKPTPTHRAQVAKILGVPSADLWPGEMSSYQLSVVNEWPEMVDVPESLWDQLITGATSQIDISAGVSHHFVTQHHNFGEIISAKRQHLNQDIQVRALFAGGKALRRREKLEAQYDQTVIPSSKGQTGSLVSKSMEALAMWTQMLDGVPGCEIRTVDHDYVYNRAMWRFDEDMITYNYGLGRGLFTTTFHIQRVDVGQKFDENIEHFERLWDLGKDVET